MKASGGVKLTLTCDFSFVSRRKILKSQPLGGMAENRLFSEFYFAATLAFDPRAHTPCRRRAPRVYMRHTVHSILDTTDLGIISRISVIQQEWSQKCSEI